MCRLFGMSSAPNRVRATFWLLDAPDSLSDQSFGNPDGTGLGAFTRDGRPQVFKQPLAAHADRAFAEEAHDVTSSTFVAHVRHASTGGLDVHNTHPFVQAGRVFAHNGVLEGLPDLDARLGPDSRRTVGGDTDSERLFALVTREIAAAGGNVETGLLAAVSWVADNLPLYSLNLLLATRDELWALRYPDTNELWLLDRASGGTHGGHHLDHAGRSGQIRVRSFGLTDAPAVVVASEPMDEDPGWRALDSGELVHVGPRRVVTARVAVPRPPAHQLTLADLRPEAAASQATPTSV